VPEESLYLRLGGHAGLSKLVKWFYAKVRYEPEVAAIFQEHVHDWPEHIQLIIDFWALMTGGPSSYGGGMGKHIFLRLKPEHFAVWLAVWEQNCLEHLPYREATEMIQLAHNIGDDLRRMSRRAEDERTDPSKDPDEPTARQSKPSAGPSSG